MVPSVREYTNIQKAWRSQRWGCTSTLGPTNVPLNEEHILGSIKKERNIQSDLSLLPDFLEQPRAVSSGKNNPHMAAQPCVRRLICHVSTQIACFCDSAWNNHLRAPGDIEFSWRRWEKDCLFCGRKQAVTGN